MGGGGVHRENTNQDQPVKPVEVVLPDFKLGGIV